MIHNVKTSGGGVQNEWTLLDEMTLTEEATQMNIPLAEGYDEYVIKMRALKPAESVSGEGRIVVYILNNNDESIDLSTMFCGIQANQEIQTITLQKEYVENDDAFYKMEQIQTNVAYNNDISPRIANATPHKVTHIFSETESGTAIKCYDRITYTRKLPAGSYYKVYGRSKT